MKLSQMGRSKTYTVCSPHKIIHIKVYNRHQTTVGIKLQFWTKLLGQNSHLTVKSSHTTLGQWGAPHGHKNHIDPDLQDPHLANLPCSVHDMSVRLAQRLAHTVVTCRAHLLYAHHMYTSRATSSF